MIRKNPLKDKTQLNDFKNKIYFAIIDADARQLAYAFVLKNSNICNDCNEKYYDCACEGDKELTGSVCRECYLNYCLCDYHIFGYRSKNTLENKYKIRFLAWKLAKETLSNTEYLKVKQYIIDNADCADSEKDSHQILEVLK